MKIQLENLVDLAMLKNAYLLAKIGADTAENEQTFVNNLKKKDNYQPAFQTNGLGAEDA